MLNDLAEAMKALDGKNIWMIVLNTSLLFFGPPCPSRLLPKFAAQKEHELWSFQSGENRLSESKFYIPTPKMGIKQIEQFSDIILRILQFLAESHSWNSFNPFPIVNRFLAGVPL